MLFICPSSQSSLMTGPRFVENLAMTTLGGYVTGKRGQVCVVPKTQQGYSPVQNPAPQGEKVAHRSGRSLAWGVWKDAHHRARAVTDACIMRASYRPSQTNCQYPNRFLNPNNMKETCVDSCLTNSVAAPRLVDEKTAWFG